MDSSELIVQGGQYVLGLGTLALLNSGLAQGKNRNDLLWFMLSLPLGPIATFLLVVMDKPSNV